ncbi:MAG: translocation/assembly module TamB, partial [Myxococcota bacterium]|nr:translocation/assembly module TamB [Myxococcota bacterium]
VEGTGSARLQGLNLESARAIVLIPSDAPIPVSTVDSEIGNVDGRIEISEVTSNDEKAMDVKVEVPRLRVALPEDSIKNAQPLGTMDKVRIGAHRGYPQTFVLVPLNSGKEANKPPTKPSAQLAIHTHLGDIEVVRGKQLRINLTGQVEVHPGATPPVTGQITLQKDGALDVEGRAFRIVSGTVTFVEADPSNPEVVITAGWTAPEGTVVYANFVGPLKTGKVTLNSEPPLPQQDIVELLRFGTTGGQQAHAQGSEANGAIGMVGGEATQPLNHALGQLGLGAVTAKIDTTEASSPKPEVEVQIAKDISVQLAVVLGTPPPGVNPDHTLLTVDWRFLSRWSLSSTLGDAGTTIFDVLWQRRY